MRIAVVTGNPKPASRTASVALAVASAWAADLPAAPGPASPTSPPAPASPGRPPGHAPAPPLVVDLAEHAPALFDWSDAELSRLTAEVAAADVAVFASPTYKAAYTGMLKAFLDRYGPGGLAGTVAVPVMTRAWPSPLLPVPVPLPPVPADLAPPAPSPAP